MNEIKYVTGDATRPEGDGNRIIAHICNDYGGWGAGFVLALSKRDPTPEAAYRDWHSGQAVYPLPFGLGKVQVVGFTDEAGLYVANMVAQKGDKCSLVWLAVCLNKLSIIAKKMRPWATVHMPRVGTGLGGETWEHVEVLVRQFLVNHSVPVTVYDLPVVARGGRDIPSNI